jgi:hypothetical protein
MGVWKHRLSGINEELKQGKCAECGLVNLYWSPCLQHWICRNKIRKKKREYKIKHKGNRKKYPYVSRFAKFKGKICEICGSTKTPCAYHDHKTNKFRGTLCRTCNSGLGMFKDDSELLSKAISYLQMKRATTP